MALTEARLISYLKTTEVNESMVPNKLCRGGKGTTTMVFLIQSETKTVLSGESDNWSILTPSLYANLDQKPAVEEKQSAS